jgi:hypothetical protein
MLGCNTVLALVDEVHKAAHAAGAGKVVFLARALVLQADAHAVVQEAQLAQALAEDFVMEIVVLLEDVGVGQKVHLGAALFGLADHLHGRHVNAVHRLDYAVLHKALANSMRGLCLRGAPSGAAILLSAFTQLTPTPCRPPDTL